MNVKLRLFKLRWIVGLIVVLLASALSATQATPGSIQGIVTDSARNMPLSKVTVELRAPGTAPVLASTITDGEGRFYLTNIKPSSYRMVAMRSGYASTEYGQRRPGGPSQNLSVAAGQRITDVRLSMIQAGAISGHVFDNGVPVGIADVVAIKVTYIEGQPSFNLVLTSRTNDLGEYHIFWLPPGKYMVMAIVWDTASNAPYYMTPDGSNDNTFLTARRSLRAVFTRASGSGAGENEAHVPFFFPGTPDRRTPPFSKYVREQIFETWISMKAYSRRVMSGARSAAPFRHPIPRRCVPDCQGGPSVRLIPLQSVLDTSEAQAPSTNAQANGSFEFHKRGFRALYVDCKCRTVDRQHSCGSAGSRHRRSWSDAGARSLGFGPGRY